MPKETFNQLKKEKKEHILRTAALVFAERGFARTDMAEIAKRAGVAKGSLYNYFDSKEDLYLFVCRDGMKRSRNSVYGGLLPDWDIYRQVDHIFRKGIAFASTYPEYVRLYLNISSAGMERFADRLTLEVEKHTADHLKRLIKRGLHEKTVRPDINPEMAAFFINNLYIMLMVSPVSRHFRIRMKEYLQIEGALDRNRIEDAVEMAIELIHDFLKPGAPEPGKKEE